MSEKLTDAEVICLWIDGKPLESLGWWMEHGKPMPKFWVPSEEIAGEWQPCPLTLDALWEVEERLTAEKVMEYLFALVGCTTDTAIVAEAVHATAEQKIKALAAILRPIVEGGAPDGLVAHGRTK